MPIPAAPGFLMVPVKVDALLVPNSGGIKGHGPFVDFSRLPYLLQEGNKPVEGVNYDQPYISETVLNAPILSQEKILEAGVHLHWALPDGLTQARPTTDINTVEFPAVPNRWLVLRYQKEQLIKKWMVMSDYLWPEGTKPEQNELHGLLTVTHHHKTPDQVNDYPFRYQGRVVDFSTAEHWEEPKSDRSDFIERLTAVGYGEPMYAAFYPNCRGVFGLHDSEIATETALEDISYEVYGWYSNPKMDALGQFINKFNRDEIAPSAEQISGKPKLKWPDAFEETFGWQLADDDTTNGRLPKQLICYAKLAFKAANDDTHPLNLSLEAHDAERPEMMRGMEMAIGNTGTEALSAYLAGKIQPSDTKARLVIERQLESLLLSDRLREHNADLGPVFEEAHHTKSFQPVSGGRLWHFRPETAGNANQEQLQALHSSDLPGRMFLPIGLEEQLHQVNILQKLYNQSLEGIQSLKQQIFADWHKYMWSVYHDTDENFSSHPSYPTFPDIDMARKHTEQLIDLLAYKNAFVGAIEFDKTTGKWQDIFKAEPLPDLPDLDHLIPDIRPEFSAWLLQQRNSDPDLSAVATQIARLLNEIKSALSISDAVIAVIRADCAQVKDTESSITLAALKAIITNTNKWFGALPDGIVKPDKAAITNLTNLSATDITVQDLTIAVQAFLSPLAALPVLFLESTPAPRYWQANEPVLLLAGSPAVISDRHGEDNNDDALACHQLNNLSTAEDTDPTKVLAEAIDAHLHAFTDDQIKRSDGSVEEASKHPAFRISDGNPWHPIFFEWEVRVDPLAQKGNLDKSQLQYAPDFISSQFILDENRSEYTQNGVLSLSKSASYISGRSILTPYANEKLETEIEKYLIRLARHFRQQLSGGDIPKKEDDPLLLAPEDKHYHEIWLDYFKKNTDAITGHFDEKHKIILEKLNDVKEDTEPIDLAPLHTILDAWKNLKELTFVQTQALSGFNNALLMLHQTIQLEIAEPNGFTAYKKFTDKVGRAIGRNNLHAAMPRADFHPLRTGQMEVYRLRLVDNFGRSFWLIDQYNAPAPSIYAPEEMKSPDRGSVILPPRITQPARLNFRWLAADRHELEANAHPDTSPVCGWVIANHFDQSIMIYAASGEPLGYIDITGRWRLSPARISPALPEDIENKALQKMVRWLIAQAAKTANEEISFVEHFLNDLRDIMNDIDPESFAQHQARSLLMGRPIALVQALVNLELKGWPAVHQDMYWYKAVLNGASYPTDGFTGVQVPFRIGERKRLNDGVAGYWLDEDDDEHYVEDTFRAPFGAPEAHTLRSTESDKLSFEHSIDAPAQRIVALMDPRGLLHCTTGILPTKALSIPNEHFISALKRLQITFLTAPLLSEPGHINLGLPEEPGFGWAWIQRDDQNWTAFSQYTVVRFQDLEKAFDNGQTIWDLLRSQGWIDPMRDQPLLAHLRRPNERTQQSLFSPDNAEQQNNIERVLNLIVLGILPAMTDARFGPTAEIREGWLTLRPTEALKQEDF